MASHNPSGKLDMMPFPGVRSGGKRRPEERADHHGASSKTILQGVCCAPIVSVQSWR